VVLERDTSFATAHRRIPDCRELLATQRSRSAGLVDSEVAAIVLYTGPMVCPHPTATPPRPALGLLPVGKEKIGSAGEERMSEAAEVGLQPPSGRAPGLCVGAGCVDARAATARGSLPIHAAEVRAGL
jgi:hypothetical protein